MLTMLIKAIPLLLIATGVIILLLTLRGKKSNSKAVDIIPIEELATIWLDEIKEKKVEEVKIVADVAKEQKLVDVTFNEATGEIIEERDIIEEFLIVLRKVINISDDGRYQAFTLFDTDNVYISQRCIERISGEIGITDDELIGELQREGYTDSGYKLYKIHNRNGKPLVYKNLNIKLFCTEDIELRKGKSFTVTNIEEVKIV